MSVCGSVDMHPLRAVNIVRRVCGSVIGGIASAIQYGVVP